MYSETQFEEAVEEFAEHFRRSKKGNLWCVQDGITLVVFIRKSDARYGWSRADGDGVTYCYRSFPDESEAMADLADNVLGLRDLF